MTTTPLAVETVAMRKVFGSLVAVDSLDLSINRGTEGLCSLRIPIAELAQRFDR